MLNPESWENWLTGWNRIVAAAKKRDWLINPLQIHKPLHKEEFELIEEEFGCSYPADFKYVLTNFASGVEFYWTVKETDESLPDELYHIFSSHHCMWSVNELMQFKTYQKDILEAFPDKNDEYELVWHNKAPFIYVPNGDVIAFDMSDTAKGCPVIYIDHEGDTFHGRKLANNFIDFIDRWTAIYGAGPEAWQFEPFYDFDKSEIDANSLSAEKFRQLMER